MKRIFTPRKSKAILIVSNDQTSADLYREKLESEQYRVEIASDCQYALRVIEIDPVDLVIVDISKWGLHGVETIRSVRSQLRGTTVSVIALSNHYFGRQLQAAEEAGADRCITKTICTPGQLATIVRATFVPDSPSSISLLPFAPLEIAGVAAPPCSDGELALEAKVTRAFFKEAPAAIARLRVRYRTFSQSTAADQRLAALSELQREVAGLAGLAGVAGFRKMAQLASALDALLMQRHEEPSAVGCRTSRTIAQAVDLLTVLLEKTTASSPEAIAPPPPSIIVIESETGSPDTICAALAKAGLGAERLDQTDAAAQLLVQRHFDLIFIDLETPGLDGLSLCTENRKQRLNRFTPVVFVTAQADFSCRARCTLSGGSDLISKPFPAPELATTALIWLCKDRPICPLLAASLTVEDSKAGASAGEPARSAVLQPWENGDGSSLRASTG